VLCAVHRGRIVLLDSRARGEDSARPLRHWTDARITDSAAVRRDVLLVVACPWPPHLAIGDPARFGRASRFTSVSAGDSSVTTAVVECRSPTSACDAPDISAQYHEAWRDARQSIGRSARSPIRYGRCAPPSCRSPRSPWRALWNAASAPRPPAAATPCVARTARPSSRLKFPGQLTAVRTAWALYRHRRTRGARRP